MAINLNNEDEVHRRAWYLYEQSLADERSKKLARQGSQLVYRAGGPHSFWMDGALSALYGPADAEREARLRDHRNQVQNHPEYRTGINTTLGTGGAATMPAWDESHFVIGAHALAPIAALATNLPLPKGNAVVLPAITTGVTAAAQSAQNVGVTDGSSTYVDAATTCDVVTVMGQITLSRQLIDQGAGYDQVIARELGAAIGATKESQIISGSGNGSNQLLGLLNQTGVQTIATTGSVAGIYDAVASAVALISTTRFRQPDFVAGSPELYAYLAASIDLQGRPFMPPRPWGNSSISPESIPAEFLGMKYVSDPQVAASLGSQYLIVGVSSDLILWSGGVAVTFSPETYANQMSVLVSAHQYLSFGLAHSSSVVLVGPFTVPGLPGS
jgi:HK97 family phage major capsid protein